MFSVEQSAFLQALGRALGHSLWQVAALWLLYTALTSVGKWSANRKYQLAAGISLAGFTWFISTAAYVYTTVPVYAQPASVYLESATEPGNSVPEFLLFLYHSTIASLQSLAPYFSCAYLLMFGLLSIRLYNAFRQVRFFATQGLQKANLDWRLFVQHHAGALGITRKVQVFASEHVPGPLTLGFWKPIILMPAASLCNLTTLQVESILLHELAHIRRYDYLVNIILQVAEVCLFFNPFMRLLLKQAKLERENSCDDYVLQFQYSPRDYSKALLAIEHNNHTAMLALAAKGNQSFQLLNRVKRMVAPEAKAFNYRQQLGMLLLFTVLLVGFTVIIPHPKKTKHTAETITIVQARKKPVTQNVEAAKAPLVIDEAPSAQPVFDIIKQITNYPKVNIQIDEKAIAEQAEKFELSEPELNALGNEMNEKMKPITDRLEAWGKKFEAVQKSKEFESAAFKKSMEELKEIPLESISAIAQQYQQKLLSKIDVFVKALPGSMKQLAFTNSSTAKNRQPAGINTNDNEDMYVSEINVEDAFDFAAAFSQDSALQQSNLINEQEIRRQSIRDARQAMREKNRELQLQKKQLEEAQKLHLGLLTDDRDTTLLNAQKLIAQAKHNSNWSFNIKMPKIPAVRLNSKYVVTVSDKNVTFTTDDDQTDAPINFQLDKQKVDVHQEKQMKNGKEEEVVVISISSSK